MAVGPAPRQDEYFDDLEVMAPEAREEHLNRGLRQAVEHAYRSAPAARDLLDGAKVSPSDIRTAKDLERLPITRKTDLIEMQRARPPYGGFLAVPVEDVERVFISPGPIYEPLHGAAIKWFARSFHAAGFRKGDVVVNTFTYHMSPAGMLFHEALRDCGATVVVMGTGNTDVQVQTMRDLRVNGFVGTPSFLMTLIKRVEELGHDFRRDFALERAWFTGEMLSGTVRGTLEDEYGIATAQAYAVTEPGGALAYECSHKSGMHLMDDYVVEIVDPASGKQLDPGEIGEIVVTPIHNRAWGLLRFGTGDMSSYTDAPCPCGRTASRLLGIVGRTSDAIKVRGMFVVARQAEQAVLSCRSVSRYRLFIGRREQRDEMTLKVELKDEAVDRQKLARELNDSFQSLCRVKIDSIEFLEQGALGQVTDTIVDERTWD